MHPNKQAQLGSLTGLDVKFSLLQSDLLVSPSGLFHLKALKHVWPLQLHKLDACCHQNVGRDGL